jgi:hypothetical protein
MTIADSKHATEVDIKAVIDEAIYRIDRHIHPAGGYDVLFQIKEQYTQKLSKFKGE